MYYIKLFTYYALYAGRLILLTGFGAIAYVTTSITEYVRTGNLLSLHVKTMMMTTTTMTLTVWEYR